MQAPQVQYQPPQFQAPQMQPPKVQYQPPQFQPPQMQAPQVQFQPPQFQAPMPQMQAPAPRQTNYLPLVFILVGLLVVAMVLVIYFARR